MSAIRAGVGVLAVVAPERAATLFGYPKRHVNITTGVFGGLFGVRELGLAAIALDSRGDAARLRRAALINAACDFGDAFVAMRALVRRDGIDRAAVMTVVPALAGTAGWVAVARSAGNSAR